MRREPDIFDESDNNEDNEGKQNFKHFSTYTN